MHLSPRPYQDELCSFFEFFDPQLKVFSEGLDEAEQDDMECDFEIAMHIRDSVIPKVRLPQLQSMNVVTAVDSRTLFTFRQCSTSPTRSCKRTMRT